MDGSPDSLRRNHLLVLAVCTLGALALALDNPLVVVMLTLCAIIVANYVQLWPYIPWPLPRRLTRHLPYAVPLPLLGFADATGLVDLCLAAVPALILHTLRRRELRVALDPRIAALMSPQSLGSKVGEAAFFGLAGISQEYVHRYAVLVVLTGLLAGWTGWLPTIAVCITSATLFLLEHLLSPAGGHTDKGTREIVTWWCVGLYFAFLVATSGALVAAMVGHVLINLPAAVRPFLRPAKKRART